MRCYLRLMGLGSWGQLSIDEDLVGLHILPMTGWIDVRCGFQSTEELSHGGHESTGCVGRLGNTGRALHQLMRAAGVSLWA